jgi:hypothetical protein
VASWATTANGESARTWRVTRARSRVSSGSLPRVEVAVVREAWSRVDDPPGSTKESQTEKRHRLRPFPVTMPAGSGRTPPRESTAPAQARLSSDARGVGRGAMPTCVAGAPPQAADRSREPRARQRLRAVRRSRQARRRLGRPLACFDPRSRGRVRRRLRRSAPRACPAISSGCFARLSARSGC